MQQPRRLTARLAQTTREALTDSNDSLEEYMFLLLPLRLY